MVTFEFPPIYTMTLSDILRHKDYEALLGSVIYEQIEVDFDDVFAIADLAPYQACIKSLYWARILWRHLMQGMNLNAPTLLRNIESHHHITDLSMTIPPHDPIWDRVLHDADETLLREILGCSALEHQHARCQEALTRFDPASRWPRALIKRDVAQLIELLPEFSDRMNELLPVLSDLPAAVEIGEARWSLFSVQCVRMLAERHGRRYFECVPRHWNHLRQEMLRGNADSTAIIMYVVSMVDCVKKHDDVFSDIMGPLSEHSWPLQEYINGSARICAQISPPQWQALLNTALDPAASELQEQKFAALFAQNRSHGERLFISAGKGQCGRISHHILRLVIKHARALYPLLRENASYLRKCWRSNLHPLHDEWNTISKRMFRYLTYD